MLPDQQTYHCFVCRHLGHYQLSFGLEAGVMFKIFKTGAIQTRIGQKTGQLQTPGWPGHYTWAEHWVGTWHSLHWLRPGHPPATPQQALHHTKSCWTLPEDHGTGYQSCLIL